MESPSGRPSDILAPIRSTVIRYFLRIGGTAVALLLVTSPFRAEPPIVIYCYLGLLAAFAVAAWARPRHLALAGALCSLGPFVLVAVLVWVRGGVAHPAGVMSFVTLVAIAGLGWGSRGALVVAALSSTILGWFIATERGVVTYNPVQAWFELSLQLGMVVALVHFGLKLLSQSFEVALSHQARFRDVIEASPEAIIALDSAGVVQMFNSAASSMSGIPARVACGKTLGELGWLKPVALASLKQALLNLSAGSAQSVLTLEFGSGQVLEAKVALVTHQGSEPDRLITLRDVTERQAAAQAREALEARIAQSKSLEALGRLAGGVAHDFNNMLTIISGTVELMMMSGDHDETQRADLVSIHEASLRAANLTNQLLAFGRKQVLQPKVVSPNKTLTQLKALIERLVRENIQLVFHFTEDLGNVYLDEARLEQVIVNLVTNASDAMPNGGTLTVETRNCVVQAMGSAVVQEVEPGDYVSIVVSDTGDGMEQETYSRIFEPFFTTKAKHGGTGLGLATVHGIVKQSGGHISVQSAPGKGTSFTLYFPRCAEQVASVLPEAEPTGVQLFGARILLTEDQPNVRNATRRMLEALGHQVLEAEDGNDALCKYGDSVEQFDVLVTDVVMPNLSGTELARRLCEMSPKLRVLLISGYTEDAIDDSLLGDRVRFLPKPFDRRTLDANLRALFVKVADNNWLRVPEQAVGAEMRS